MDGWPRQGGPSLGGNQRRAGGSLRHAGSRLPQRHRQHAAAVARPGSRRLRSGRVQRRRLHGVGAREERSREHQHGALPERRHRERQGAAAASAVFPRLGHAAGCDPALGERTRRRLHRVRREELLPAQRHPPELRRGRADAPAGRRERTGVEPRLGHHHAHHGLHQPHAAARGAGELAGAHVRAAAAASAGDHLRDQRDVRHRDGAALAGRQRAPAPHVADRGRAGAAGAHGLPRHRRQLLGQRRGRAAFAAAARGPVPRLLRAVAGEVQQQDQRRHPAALDRLGQSGAGASSSARPSASGWITDLDQLRGLRRTPRRNPSARAGRRSSRPTRSPGRHGGRGVRRRLRSARDVRRAGQAHPRIQAPAAQRAARHPPVRPHQAWRHRRLDAALRADRRQGRARLLPGQAHHQADQQRGRRDQ